MKRFILHFISCAALLGLGACTHGTHIDTPDGFAELDGSDHYVYRAADAQGVAIGIRSEANDPEGDLSFWSGVVDASLRRRGYEAIEGERIESANGVAGKRIAYRTHREGREHFLWVAVYVTDSSVVTVEAGGDAELVAPQKKALDRAISSLII